MENNSGQEMEGCTFTWKLENLLWNALGREDSVKSKTFTFTTNGLKTSWELEIFPSRTRKQIKIYLCRIGYEESQNISGGFELSLVTTDGNIMPNLCVEEELPAEYRMGCNWDWDDLLMKRLLYFPNDCFTVRCRLWTTSSLTKSHVEYDAMSRIQTTKISYRKSISILEALSSNYEIKCSPLPTDKLEIILYRKDNSEYMSVKLNGIGAEKYHLNCKLSVLDTRKILLHETENTYLVISLSDCYSSDDDSDAENSAQKLIVQFKGNALDMLDEIKISDNNTWDLQNCILLKTLTEKMNSLSDVINFELEIIMGTSLVESHITNIKIIQPHDITHVNECSKIAFDPLIHELETLYSEKKYADVQLKSGKEIFSVHKVLLCTRSPVFSAMFDNDMAEKNTGVVEIEDMDTSTLDKLLLFIYTGRLKDLEEDMAMKLLAAADKYQIISLKQQCATFLQGIISDKNVCQILQVADMHHEESLKKVAQEFICDNHRCILSSNEWTHFISLQGQLANEIFQKLSVKYLNL